MDDAQAVGAACEGSKDAFAAIYDRYSKPLYSFLAPAGGKKTPAPALSPQPQIHAPDPSPPASGGVPFASPSPAPADRQPPALRLLSISPAQIWASGSCGCQSPTHPRSVSRPGPLGHQVGVCGVRRTGAWFHPDDRSRSLELFSLGRPLLQRFGRAWPVGLGPDNRSVHRCPRQYQPGRWIAAPVLRPDPRRLETRIGRRLLVWLNP
jgi:hypothetical protein